jgi:hypothetical protein
MGFKRKYFNNLKAVKPFLDDPDKDLFFGCLDFDLDNGL